MVAGWSFARVTNLAAGKIMWHIFM